MEKYLNKQFAKRLLIIGGVLYTVSYVLNAVTVYSIFSNDCVGSKTNPCTLHAQQIVGKIAMAIGYPGIVIFLIGLALLLIVLVTKRR